MPQTLSRALICSLAALLLLACGDDGDDPTPPAPRDTAVAETSPPSDVPDAGPDVATEEDTVAPDPGVTFGESFLFGTAIAGFQVEMGCPTLPAEQCEDRQSDWYAFITDPATTGSPSTYIHGDPPSAAPGYWELYDADHQRAAEGLKTGAIRFSFEWSRIFPTATDDVEGYDALKAIADPIAIAHYHAMIDSMKARGLTPLATLNHYTLPLWIHDGVGCHVDFANCSPRGWHDRERTVTEVAKYAGFIAKEFGADIDHWVTLNEPFAVLLPGYLLPSEERTNPPAVLFQTEAARVVMMALIEAHARMYDAIHLGDVVDANGDGAAAEVGVVYPMTPTRPKDPDNPLDVKAAENLFYLYNLVYLNAVAGGIVDEKMDGNTIEREDLKNRMDFLGLNYYTRVGVEGSETALEALSPLATFNALSLDFWENYPRGIYEMAMFVKETWDLPVIITENGSPDVADDLVARGTLVRVLTWVARAVEDGVDLRGYFYWTLIDNYEWNHGLSMRFGLYHVDETVAAKPRTMRPFAQVYAEIAGGRRISPELLAAWPIVE